MSLLLIVGKDVIIEMKLIDDVGISLLRSEIGMDELGMSLLSNLVGNDMVVGKVVVVMMILGAGVGTSEDVIIGETLVIVLLLVLAHPHSFCISTLSSNNGHASDGIYPLIAPS